MNSQVLDLLKSFESDSKNPKKRYNDFLAHVYIVFEKQITSCKSDKIMNKYKKMRNSVLSYVAFNEKSIISKLSK